MPVTTANKDQVRKVLDRVKSEGRSSLTAARGADIPVGAATASAVVGRAAASARVSSECTRFSSCRITNRLMRFSSSRTFPGHGYSRNAARNVADGRGAGRPYLEA